MIRRLLKPSIKRSFFLFGARGTGKSTLLRECFSEKKPLFFNLLEPELEHRFHIRPSQLKEEILALENCEWVIIDEVQKVPKLLDVVHDLIESEKIKFALTGSSSRKLKAGGANLLAGRASVFHLYPFSVLELKKNLDLQFLLEWGLLPAVWNEEDPIEKRRILRAYSSTYLKEEIQLEQLVRNIEPFHRFLPVAAQQSGKIINFSALAREAQIEAKSVQRFYEILEDTLIGFSLPSYSRSIRKQQTQKSKFFIFDLGVKRALEGTLDVALHPRTGAYGQMFEHFIVNEIFKLNSTLERDYRLSYLLTKDGLEVDLIIERPGLTTLLIEIKSKDTIHPTDFRHLKTVKSDFKNAELMVICNSKKASTIEGVKILPWLDAIQIIFEA